MAHNWRHGLSFSNKRNQRMHKRECGKILANPYTCVFQLENEQCCGQKFKRLSTLIIHVLRVHNVYQCDMCYKTFAQDDIKSLEHHHHDHSSLWHCMDHIYSCFSIIILLIILYFQYPTDVRIVTSNTSLSEICKFIKGKIMPISTR